MSANPLIVFAVLPVAAYLAGATPFAFLIARAKGIDLRKVGSGNVGATNCGRACGKVWGYLCFLLDVAKGAVPVLIAGAVMRGEGAWVPAAAEQAAWLLTGCCAILGHVFTFWLKFRGGKGVATSLGVVLGIWPFFTAAGLIALGVWVVVVLVSRYVSLASVAAALVFVPAFVLLWPRLELWPMAAFAGAMCALIVIRHRTNISRLLAGTENKIGRKKQGSS